MEVLVKSEQFVVPVRIVGRADCGAQVAILKHTTSVVWHGVFDIVRPTIDDQMNVVCQGLVHSARISAHVLEW